MRGKIKDFSIKYGSKVQCLLLEISDDFRNQYEELKDCELEITIKKYSPKRSKDINAKMWVLIGKLAEKLNISNVEVYREYVKDYGVFNILPVPNEDVDLYIKAWGVRGLGWIAESMRESKIKGYTNIVCYYGTSMYTREQFVKILNQVIEDCHEQGIDTDDPREIERLVDAYFNNQQR